MCTVYCRPVVCSGVSNTYNAGEPLYKTIDTYIVQYHGKM